MGQAEDFGGDHMVFRGNRGGGEFSRRQQSLKRRLWKIDCLWGGIIRVIQSRMGEGGGGCQVNLAWRAGSEIFSIL